MLKRKALRKVFPKMQRHRSKEENINYKVINIGASKSNPRNFEEHHAVKFKDQKLFMKLKKQGLVFSSDNPVEVSNNIVHLNRLN